MSPALRRLAPKFPGLIVAVGLTSALVPGRPAVDTIFSRFGPLPSALPAPALPDISLARLTSCCRRRW